MNAQGKIMQVITLVNDKNVFNETLNVSCNIWHCKPISGRDKPLLTGLLVRYCSCCYRLSVDSIKLL
jgi:hypothetical protein